MSIALELRKLRRTRLAVLVLGMLCIEVLWQVLATDRGGRTTDVLADSVITVVMLFPLVAGMVAVRLVGVDRNRRMGQWLAARGHSRTGQFLTKLVVADLIVVTYHLAFIGLVLLAAVPLDLVATPGLTEMLGPIVAVTVLAGLAVTAAHLALAQTLRQPAASVSLGLVAGLTASALPYMGAERLGWLAPWGLLTAANPTLPLTMTSRHSPEVQMVENVPATLIWAAVMATAWSLLAVALVVGKERSR